MLFERIGTFALKRSVFWSLFSLSMLIVPIAASFLFPLFKEQREFQEELEMARNKSCQTFLARRANLNFQKTYQNADPLFLKKLESLPLLEKEKAALLELSKISFFKEDNSLKQRWKFLEDNHLSFSEENVLSQNEIKETDQKITHPVELLLSDIHKLLSTLEEPNAPQIIITDFNLKKIPNSNYELNMQLIQREYQ
ncbi:MAG TPA: hypothetical protein VLG44_08125 [Chlamydiales bacterium]|nr:hypothetical protein [Chlamydiales bacterium]